MLNMKLLSSIVFMTCLLSAIGHPKPDVVDSCLITQKCPTIENTVWTTDQYQCYIFTNPCEYENDVCHRKKVNDTELQVISKDLCKRLCREFCSVEYAPVCVEYNNKVATFTNKCAFDGQRCKDEKPYKFIHSGQCELHEIA